MSGYRKNPDGAFTQSVKRALEEHQAEEKEKKRGRITGAHTTMPIEDMRMVKKWLDIARDHDAHMREGGVSWYLMIMLGFNTSLRIGDLCRLRVDDVRGREWVRVVAQKTDKMSDVKPLMLEMPSRFASGA